MINSAFFNKDFWSGKRNIDKFAFGFLADFQTGRQNGLERCRLQPAKRPEMLKSSKYFLENAEVG